MIWAVAFALWITLTAGLYLALSRDVLRCVVGLALLGSAVNLLLLAAGRLGSAQPAVIEAGGRVLQEAANPLPQALVLTAIVIAFAMTAVSIVIAIRSRADNGSDHVDGDAGEQAFRRDEQRRHDDARARETRGGGE